LPTNKRKKTKRRFLSYPRTESTAYPASLDIGELLRQQTRSPVWGEHAADLLPNNWTKPKAGTGSKARCKASSIASSKAGDKVEVLPNN
jgi:DNA topoisomerase-3